MYNRYYFAGAVFFFSVAVASLVLALNMNIGETSEWGYSKNF